MSQNLQLRPLPTPEELAHAAAVDWLGLLKRRADLSKAFGVALSGGRIARAFYDAVVSVADGNLADFDNVHFFWADERCVPPFDPESNYSIAHPNLFVPLQIQAENIHRIRAELPGDYPVQEAEAEICRIMPLSQGGQPILDLVILGMGEDGHVASLFPEENPAFVHDAQVYRRVRATKPPPDRVTLGYQPLFCAKEVWVLASGSGKRPALERLKSGDQSLPIARVAAGRPETIVFHETY
jgi:6-phosphogluconolactonase